MTPEQQAAYISSQVACAIIEMESMKAANAALDVPPHAEADFMDLIRKYGIHTNTVIGWMS